MRRPDPLLVTRSADRFSAFGAEPRLQILRLLLAAHPTGMVPGEVQEELGIPASTLSHHLEKLKQVGLVKVRRESTYLWYSADTEALREVMSFLYEECCTRSRAVPAEPIAIENIPLPDDSVDVIISNCVINLSGDKDRVLAEAFRVL